MNVTRKPAGVVPSAGQLFNYQHRIKLRNFKEKP